MTAHKVMRALREEGAIHTLRRIGSFVSPPDTPAPSEHSDRTESTANEVAINAPTVRLCGD